MRSRYPLTLVSVNVALEMVRQKHGEFEACVASIMEPSFKIQEKKVKERKARKNKVCKLVINDVS